MGSYFDKESYTSGGVTAVVDGVRGLQNIALLRTTSTSTKIRLLSPRPLFQGHRTSKHIPLEDISSYSHLTSIHILIITLTCTAIALQSIF